MIGSNFDLPIMYQDLAESSMMMPMMPFGTALASPYLGGVQLQRQLDADKVYLQHRDDENTKKTARRALSVIGVIAGITFLPALFKSVKTSGGIVKYFKDGWNSLRTMCKSKPVKPKGNGSRFFRKTKIFTKRFMRNAKHNVKNFGNKSKNLLGNFRNKFKSFCGKTKDKSKIFYGKVKEKSVSLFDKFKKLFK